MLAVSSLSNTTNKDERGNEMESFTIGGGDDFPDFMGENLLDSIDFDDLFVGINDGDLLPDLEMDAEIFAEFSVSSGDESDVNNYNISTPTTIKNVEQESCLRKEEVEKTSSVSASDLGSGLTSLNYQGDEIVSAQKSEESAPPVNQNPLHKESDKGKKSSAQSKNNPQGKRKVKVDWTPELHRRFVQAVEQLGVDKAVPSRILEIMGIDCLTRHNIASHLQKYRSHRKHLLAREAEAASWSQRRQIYGGAAAGGGGGKREINPWPAPTIGFPPPPPMATPMPHFRPLHVWGHPSVDQSYMHMWPKHLAPSPSPHQHPSPAWPPPSHLHLSPPADPSFWHPHHQRIPNSLTPGTTYFPAPIAPTRYHAPHPVPGIPPPAAMYKVDPGIGVRTAVAGAGQPLPKPPCDFHPSKESIDAAIGDVLSKPWLPLPLGLKPPAVDSVLGELQRQGVPKIPPTCA
ncbi:transcription activator GLK1-like [Nicotiana tomentosiformis]|uniref:transcription activator GLK1-like n=1 Tax=Nicotiana tomentosiformis TaxID=4098 RepID=UPI00051B476C|nr:transcription activator GLK1-like [Nicotiana tomentosiformis]XP_018626614.1 transcription activator GLK1-like [Nicotiana tomentosiformis]